MSAIAQEEILKAANTMAQASLHFELHIRDQIPLRMDWDDFSRVLCYLLRQRGGTTMQDQLDVYWEDNDTFIALISYIDADCGFE